MSAPDMKSLLVTIRQHARAAAVAQRIADHAQTVADDAYREQLEAERNRDRFLAAACEKWPELADQLRAELEECDR